MPTRLPSLFLSHGSPMLAILDSAGGRCLDALGGQLPWPKAILVASAHFAADHVTLGAHPQPQTLHDFNGFPESLHRIRYAAPGSPDLAQEAIQRLAAAGIPARVHENRGLDHGVWVPLRRMYPSADIPVVPLSVMPRGTAAQHYDIGRALAPLRQQGVLVLGSGRFAHDHDVLDWEHGNVPPAPRTQEFSDWMHTTLAAGDWDALLDWQQRAPHARHAHPTAEYLMPLFVALGAAGETPQVRTIHRSHECGPLAVDAFAFD